MSDLKTALKKELLDLEEKLEDVLEQRNFEIQVARDKYAGSLKALLAKQGRLKRMMRSAEALGESTHA